MSVNERDKYFIKQIHTDTERDVIVLGACQLPHMFDFECIVCTTQFPMKFNSKTKYMCNFTVMHITRLYDYSFFKSFVFIHDPPLARTKTAQRNGIFAFEALRFS